MNLLLDNFIKRNKVLLIILLIILILFLLILTYFYFSGKLLKESDKKFKETDLEAIKEEIREEFDYSMPSESKEEKDDKNIASFYADEYHLILEKKSTYDCNIKLDISMEEKLFSVNMNCNISPPYSAFEAFLASVRGKIEKDGVIFDSGISKEAKIDKAFKERIEIMNEPIGVVSDSESDKSGSSKKMCFLPCVDGLNPSSFEVLDISYNPSQEVLNNLFNNYKEDTFKDLDLNSSYSLKAHYEKMEDCLEWRYLIGQFYSGKFSVDLFLDKEVKEVLCQREDSEFLEEDDDFNCDVSRIDENNFKVSGFTDGFYKLVIKF
jgi:hypothetical protein